MTPSEYRRMTLARMRAKRWRTAEPLETRAGNRLEAGVEVTIIGKAGGLVIRTPVCAHCSMSFYCRKVHPSAVEEIP